MSLLLLIASSQSAHSILEYRFLAIFVLQISFEPHKMWLKQSTNISGREVTQ